MRASQRVRRLRRALVRQTRHAGARITRAWRSRVLPAPTETETKLIRELRERLAQLEPLGPPVLGVENIWLEFRRQFRRLFTTRDPRAFLQWELIRRSLYNAGPLPGELRALMASPEWATRWGPALREVPAGRPDRCPPFPDTSWNLVHHAFALSHFERTSGRRVEDFRLILEFGGGYGSMARLAWQLGFRGCYVIYDLPEMCAVQSYFLTSIGVPVGSAGQPASNPAVYCASTPPALAQTIGSRPADLFLATWSLSETPEAFREAFLSGVRADHFLFGYEDRYRGIDNSRFFADWTARHAGHRWSEWPSPHERGVSYLVGLPSVRGGSSAGGTFAGAAQDQTAAVGARDG